MAAKHLMAIVACLFWLSAPGAQAATLVVTGYDYAVTGSEIEEITAPNAATVPDPDGYFIDFASNPGSPLPLAVGGTLNVGTFAVTDFQLRGIDPALGLDPTSATAFPLGLSFKPPPIGTPITVALTPVVTNVPVPPAALLLLSGVAALYCAGGRRAATD